MKHLISGLLAFFAFALCSCMTPADYNDNIARATNPVLLIVSEWRQQMQQGHFEQAESIRQKALKEVSKARIAVESMSDYRGDTLLRYHYAELLFFYEQLLQQASPTRQIRQEQILAERDLIQQAHEATKKFANKYDLRLIDF